MQIDEYAIDKESHKWIAPLNCTNDISSIKVWKQSQSFDLVSIFGRQLVVRFELVDQIKIYSESTKKKEQRELKLTVKVVEQTFQLKIYYIHMVQSILKTSPIPFRFKGTPPSISIAYTINKYINISK